MGNNLVLYKLFVKLVQMSSGFKENFEKGGGDDDLDYDESAFYYFSMAMLCIILIPATYNMIISPIFFGDM